MADHPALVAPIKSLASFPGWSQPDATSYSWFNAPLEIDGVIEPGLILHGGCYINRPDAHVTFELHLARTPGRPMRPLERVDWRSLRGTHSNVRKKDRPPSCPARVTNTHLHAFDLNWDADKLRMKGVDLPYAREIEEVLGSFEELRDFAGKQFKISNIELVAAPPWEYDLGLGEP